jgi:hypothetical protein
LKRLTKLIDISELDKWYLKLWGTSAAVKAKERYGDFGEAPDDNPGDLQHFASRVRRCSGHISSNSQSGWTKDIQT